MPSLQDLPAELHRQILSTFVPRASPQWEVWNQFRTGQLGTGPDLEDAYDHESPESLYNMCLVSKQFLAIAQPLLWSNFVDEGTLGDIEETVRIADNLYRYPELGQFVQDFTISGPILFNPEIADEDDLEISEDQIQRLTTAIQALSLGAEEDKWISAVQNCDKYSDIPVWAALVFNKTPNLRRVVMPGTISSVNPFPELFRRNPSFLRMLEKLGLEGQKPADGYDYASYNEFFALPNLKIVMFENGDLQSRTCPSWEPKTFNIEELVFRDSVIDAVSLSRLAGACKKLKVFLLDNFKAHEEWINHPNGGSVFNAAEAYQALLPHKETLEHLRIEFARGVYDLQDWQRFVSSRAKIGSLREFSALNDIRLQQAIVPVHPQFPATLKRLYITDCNSSVIDLVRNIARDCRKGLYPDFVEFRMLAVDITQPILLPGQSIPDGQTPEQAHQSLVDLFKGTNVDFFIAPFEMPDMDELMGGYGDDDDDEEGWEDEDEDDDDDDEHAIDGFDGFDDDVAYDSEGNQIKDPFMDALRAARRGRAGRGGSRATRDGVIRGPNGPMPEGLLNYFMQQAMQDPEFLRLHPPSGGNQ
ncbi:uncharacterized protein N7483_013075 [Penicillium malachiteum]|uniref:uncharacterized protein n=1 Tax=Penicillium malachiteum TaxID=1324776 RepID=UPI0025494AE6|nr:uncharacterized protein N7483_013075 [Penicillium malachiteum]KAJ5715894.1 hypothetical protein N7483_013075 [Penicillium malachiteum]